MPLTPAIVSMLIAATAMSAPRQPTANWVVNFDDAQCLASRSYGSTEEPLHLVLKAPPVGGVMHIAVVRNAGNVPPSQVDATIAIDGQPPIKTNMLMFSPKNSKQRVYTSNMPSGEFARVRGAKSLSIRSSGLNETFSITDIEALLKVMDECVADLRQAWNVSSEDGETSKLVKRAQSQLGKYVNDEDYPAHAIMEEATGSVRFTLLIDEAGRVADCTVIETSGVAVLDAQTCAIIKRRAKFEPAVGPDEKPAKDAVMSRITWAMPR